MKSKEELQALFKKAQAAKAKQETRLANATRLLSLAGRSAAGSTEDLTFVNNMYEEHKLALHKFDLETKMFEMLKVVAPEITGDARHD